MNDPFDWIKIADSLAEFTWQENGMCVVEVEGKKITLASINQTIHAFAHKCPHAGGIMADGYFDALGKVVCPLHRYRFDTSTGRNTSGEGYYLKTYPIKELGEGVFIGFKKSFWR